MITLKNFADLIKKEISATDSDVDIDERFIFLKVRQHMNEQFKLEVYNRRNMFDKSAIAQYIYTYPEQQVNSDGPYKSITLPDFYPSLPYNKGIYQICPSDDPHNPLIKRNFPSVFNHLKAGKLQGLQGYWIEGLKVYFMKSLPHGKVIVKLLLPAPDAISDTDPLPITPEIQAEIVRRIKIELLNIPGEDLVNNEVDDRRSQ